MIKFQLETDANYFREGFRHYGRAGRLSRLKSVAKTATVVVCPVFAALSVWVAVYRATVIFLCIPLVFPFVSRTNEWTFGRMASRSPFANDTITFELDESQYRAVSVRQDVRLQWSVFTKAVSFADGILLFQGPGVFVWFPARALGDDAQVMALLRLLALVVPEHKIVSPVRGLIGKEWVRG